MFVQHSRYRESLVRKNVSFSCRCIEPPTDPGKFFRIPHILQMVSEKDPTPYTMFAFELTLTRTACFIQNLTYKYNVNLEITKADKYLFLDLVLDYIQTTFVPMYDRKRLVIYSNLAHFAEMAAKKDFYIGPRHKDTPNEGWRAIKWLDE